MMMWGLPKSAEIGGQEYTINTDFRDILEIIGILQDRDKSERIRLLVALSLFYDGFEEMPSDRYEEAVKWMFDFISLGEEDNGQPQEKMIDWEQDRMLIASEVNKVAGCEVRALEHLHWWTFIGYFNAIGEGQLSYIVSIREKLRKGKKLDKTEREWYQKNRHMVDFKQTLSESEKAILKEWGV